MNESAITNRKLRREQCTNQSWWIVVEVADTVDGEGQDVDMRLGVWPFDSSFQREAYTTVSPLEGGRQLLGKREAERIHVVEGSHFETVTH